MVATHLERLHDLLARLFVKEGDAHVVACDFDDGAVRATFLEHLDESIEALLCRGTFEIEGLVQVPIVHVKVSLALPKIQRRPALGSPVSVALTMRLRVSYFAGPVECYTLLAATWTLQLDQQSHEEVIMIVATSHIAVVDIEFLLVSERLDVVEVKVEHVLRIDVASATDIDKIFSLLNLFDPGLLLLKKWITKEAELKLQVLEEDGAVLLFSGSQSVREYPIKMK